MEREDSPNVVRTYTVKSGDTLSSIAEKYYDDASKYQVIYDANKEAIGPDPNHVKVGTELKIPFA